MTELLPLLLAFVAGTATALLYLSLLWVSVRRLARQSRPGLSMLIQLIVRMGFVAASFYGCYVFTGIAGLLSALLGFTVVRLVLSAVLSFSNRDTQGASR